MNSSIRAAAPQAAPSGARTKVLIVDDSALVRKVLTEIIAREADMHVVGAAPNPLVAREMIRATDPDVLTLDIEMPQMDGLDFLEKLMRLRPMPVVMVSTLTERGSEATLRALELGAIDFIAKPKLDVARGIESYAEEIVAKIRVAARVPRRRPSAPPQGAVSVLPDVGAPRVTTEKLIFVGASTGGTEAIREFLQRLPPDSPAVLIAQHMPAGFTRTFAARLDGLCRLRVSEASGERVLPGHVYIAPGGRHLRAGRSGAHYVTLVDDGPPINRHKPSVEALFLSAAAVAGPNAIGVMLTGMGNDGARAMRAMKDAGAYNVAQDEASCVVFGMPKEAIAAGAVDHVLPLSGIAPDVMRHLASHAQRANRG